MLKNTALFFAALLIAGLLAEGASRLIYPIEYGHKYFDQDGAPIHPVTGGAYGLTPGLAFVQKTQEFEKRTTHTARGFRGPSNGFMDPRRPDLIFIGDSMTYGIGLADEETIPYLYCAQKNLRCINLARPGTSTGMQLDLLEAYFKEERARPRQVFLIMNVMTTVQFGGNDLTDNLYDARRAQQASSPAQSTEVEVKPGIAAYAFEWRKAILGSSNLARLTFYVFGPAIKSIMAPGLEENEKIEALKATQDHLLRLEELSRKHGFSVQIILVHPIQDLLRVSYVQTQEDIQSILPEKFRIRGTGDALLKSGNIQDYYYPLDGHVTPKGAAVIADHLAAQD